MNKLSKIEKQDLINILKECADEGELDQEDRMEIVLTVSDLEKFGKVKWTKEI